MRVWPGQPFPLGPWWDGEGTNFSLFSEHAEQVELCLFDAADRETRYELTERTAFNWHGYLPGVGPGQRYGYRVHGPWAPEQGHRFNPEEAADRPLREGDRGPDPLGAREHAAVRPGEEDADLERDDEDDAEAIPKGIVIDAALRLGGRPAAADALARDRHLRGAREGLHEAARERPRGPARHLRRPRLGGGARTYLTSLGVTAVELLPDPPHRRRAGARRQGADELLGLQLDRLPRAARGLRGDRLDRRPGARVQGHGQGAAPRRDRGDPRRRLQPHRRGQPPRADAVVQGDRQPLLLPLVPGDPRTTWTTRARATRSTPCTRACCG